MLKKTVALATLASFFIFSCSCVSYKKTPLISVKPENRAKLNISAVQVHSGEKTEFTEDSDSAHRKGYNRLPIANIHGDSVIGMAVVKNIALEKPKIKYPSSLKTGGTATITTTDEVVYKAYRIIYQDDSSVTFDAATKVSIPLEDVDFIWIQEHDIGATLAFITVAIAVAVGLTYGILVISGFSFF